MPPPILTQEELRHIKCEVPDCDCNSDEPLVMHANCHLQDPPWVVYHQGLVTIMCSVCNKVSCQIAVAEHPPEGGLVSTAKELQDLFVE